MHKTWLTVSRGQNGGDAFLDESCFVWNKDILSSYEYTKTMLNILF